MKKIHIIIIAILLALLAASCESDTPSNYYVYEDEPTFSWGFADFYGVYYSNYQINNNVLTLNLFTEGLFINDDEALDGIGQYLIIEDVFSAPTDTFLMPGTYHVSESAEPFTFYSGMKFVDNQETISSGAYLYYIEADATKSKIAYVTGGSFTVSMKNDSVYSIKCDFVLDGKNTFTGKYEQPLLHFDRSKVIINDSTNSISYQRLREKFK